MKILKLLNNKYLSILLIFFLLGFNAKAEDEPIDIWSIDKNDVEEVINYAKKQGEECFIVGEIIENSPKKVFFEGNLEKWSRMD